MQTQLGVHPRTVIREIRFLRLGNGTNLELFAYDAADGQRPQPRNSAASPMNTVAQVPRPMPPPASRIQPTASGPIRPPR